MAKTIVLADGDLGFSDGLGQQLAAAGYEVISAMDGLDALRQARTEDPQLVVLETQLPVLDGYKVCRLLKFDRRRSRLPVCFVSSEEDEQASQLGREVGADAFFRKSSGVDSIVAAVNQLMSGGDGDAG